LLLPQRKLRRNKSSFRRVLKTRTATFVVKCTNAKAFVHGTAAAAVIRLRQCMPTHPNIMVVAVTDSNAVTVRAVGMSVFSPTKAVSVLVVVASVATQTKAEDIPIRAVAKVAGDGS
jgi:hypothetical protein